MRVHAEDIMITIIFNFTHLHNHLDPYAKDWNSARTWDYFGAQVYIVHISGTEQSSKRLANAKKELNALGLWEKAIVWPAKVRITL